METEIWKDINGFEGTYQVSSLGRVCSLSRPIWNGHRYVLKKARILKPNALRKGYLQVYLYDKGKRRCSLVHRLVAESFITNPHSYPQINHIDGNKQCNHVQNLEWCNNSMNQIHAYKIGLNWHREGAGRPPKKILQIDKNNQVVACWQSIAECVAQLCLDRANLQRVLRKSPHYKTCKGFKFEYADEYKYL